jgi:glycosyltransferase involved in cell wall biosynthesis
LDLIVVMPAYNEGDCIAEVVTAWRRTLTGLAIDFRILVLDDGSTDDTVARLAVFSDDSRIEVITKPNRGHGPAILDGYRLAAAQADWVFQCDADDEMSPDAFPALWRMREDLDALFGFREGRSQPLGRRLISAVSRLTVNLAYAPGVDDVNTPYRLMRSAILGPIVAAIPATTFAPNVVISGTMALADLRIANIPVPHRARRTGAVSIVKWRLWKAAARSLVQTVALAPAMHRMARVLRGSVEPERVAS